MRIARQETRRGTAAKNDPQKKPPKRPIVLFRQRLYTIRENLFVGMLRINNDLPLFPALFGIWVGYLWYVSRSAVM
jgi:hypothetical protein